MALASVATRIATAEARLATVNAAIEKAETASSWSAGDWSVERGGLPDLYKERSRIERQLNTLYLMQRRASNGKRAGGMGVRGISFQ